MIRRQWRRWTVLTTVALLPHFLIFSFSQSQSGKASFYSKRSTGTRTASGERLHHDSLTCAHRSYPFGTLLKVTNVINGKEVVVRVNDRGPFRRGRIIDLSWGAAKAIGMIAQGIVPVTVEKLHETIVPFKPDDDDYIQPKFEFELADIDPADLVPAWQQDIKIDHQKVWRSMHRTASESAEDARQAVKKTVTAAEARTNDRPADVLDIINQTPNVSKVYLKRQRK